MRISTQKVGTQCHTASPESFSHKAIFEVADNNIKERKPRPIETL
jgi:hypothetical protein